MKILTFDLEEWFHILDNESTSTQEHWSRYERRFEANLDRILSSLEERNQKATFFCLGWIAREYPEKIRHITELGHELATHSDQHQLAYIQSPGQFRNDLRESIKSLEDITGKKINAYRAPGFSVKAENSWVFEVLIDEGIEIDCSIFPASRAHGGFPSFGEETPTIINCKSGTIKEFPISTYSIFGKQIIFSGGGYFRILPYKFIKYYTNRSQYVMTYFHPRDFDSDQPMINDLPLIRRFKSYYGLKAAKKKFERFIDEYIFISLGEADSLVDWNVAPVCNLSDV